MKLRFARAALCRAVLFLLAFGAGATHSSAADERLEFNLPERGESGWQGTPWTEFDEVSGLNYAVCVQLLAKSAEGAVGVISVRTADGEICLESLSHLETYLKRKQLGWKRRRINLSVDSTVKYAHMISVVDLCRRVGFTAVGFEPPPHPAEVQR
jgi:hypothetical protein